MKKMSEENKIPLSVMLESAKSELRNTIRNIKSQYNFPSSVMEGVIHSILVEVQTEEKIEIINETNAIIQKKNEEIAKAREAAKKVIKAESEGQEEAEKQQKTIAMNEMQ